MHVIHGFTAVRSILGLMLLSIPAVDILRAVNYNSTWEAGSGLLPDQVCPSYRRTPIGPAPFLSGGVMTTSTTDFATNVSYVQEGSEIVSPLPDPIVVEARVRFVSSDTCCSCGPWRQPISFGFVTAPATGTALFIGPDTIFLTNGECSGLLTNASVDTDDSFHTYRIEISRSGAVTVYYDDMATLAGHTYTSSVVEWGSVPSTGFSGDGSGVTRGTSEWIHFRHNAHATGCLPGACDYSPPSVVSWWPGDGNVGDIVDGNHGALQGGTYYVPAKAGSGFTLDSNDDRVVVPTNSNLDVQLSGFTSLLWMRGVKNQPDPSLATLVEKSHGWVDNTGWAHSVESATGFPHFTIGDGTGFPEVIGTVDVLDDRFHLLAGTWESGTMRFYVDGVLHGTESNATPANNTRDVNIGFTWGGGTPRRFFRGIADEVQVYNRALSACEIRSLFEADSYGVCRGDADSDGIVDYDDNCPLVQNPTQDDTDVDGAGDVCDCAPADPTLLRVPGEVDGLRVGVDSDDNRLDWCATEVNSGSGTRYDLVRGLAQELPVGSGSSEVCLGLGLVDPEATDSTAPVPSAGFWYLVRGRNGCGAGTYGFTSGGTERVPAAPCP